MQLRIALTIAALLMPLGCSDDGGGGDGTVSTTTTVAARELTLDEATRLAGTLVANHEAGGAHVVVDAPAEAGERLVFEGEVDWISHVGRVSAQDRVAYFDLVQLFEGGVPGVSEAAARVGRPGARWVRRDLRPDTIPMDQVLRLVNNLAADRADNPVLLVQGDSRWLRADEVDGVSVDVVRYGPRLVHWVGVDDGVLRRVEAEFEGLEGTVLITLSDHGPRSLEVPPSDDTIEVADLAAPSTSTTG